MEGIEVGEVVEVSEVADIVNKHLGDGIIINVDISSMIRELEQLMIRTYIDGYNSEGR